MNHNRFLGLNIFPDGLLAAKQVPGGLSRYDFFYRNEGFTVTLPTPVTAIGFYANVNNPDTFTISLPTGFSTTQTISAYDTQTFDFIGVTSSTPFQSVTLLSSDYNIPEIEYGTAISSGVPEPSTWAMMLLGFGGLGLLGRRKSRKTNAASMLAT